LPSAVWVLSENFTEQNKMINSTMKMVRPVITSNFKDAINWLYTPDSRDICNIKNLANIQAIYAEKQ
jgi:long-chain acyl-CoA synthetase